MSARATLLPESGPAPAGALTASRRLEPSIGDLSVPGPAAKMDTLEVPVMLPTGPLRVDVAYPVLKASYDETEWFRFSIGTRF